VEVPAPQAAQSDEPEAQKVTDVDRAQSKNVESWPASEADNAEKAKADVGNASKKDSEEAPSADKAAAVVSEPTSPWPEPAAEPISEPLAEPKAKDTPRPAETPRPVDIPVVSEGLIHQGSLAIDRQGKVATRYFTLFEDRLDYFAQAGDLASGQAPRGRVLLADVDSIDVLEMGWVLNLVNDRSLALRAFEKSEWAAWDAAWKKVFESEEPAQEQTSMESPPTAQEPQAEEQIQEQMQEQVQVQAEAQVQDDAPFLQGSLHEGVLTTRGAPKYVALFPDRLEYWADASRARRGSRSQACITKSAIQDLEVVGNGFDIKTKDGLLPLRAFDAASVEPWMAAFSKIFSEEPPPEQSDSAEQPEPSAEDSPGRQTQPRLLWQSMLEVHAHRHNEWSYFALYDDALCSYSTPNDLVEGRQPKKRINHERIKNVEFSTNGFFLHFVDGGKQSLRVSNEIGIMQAWVTAWQKVSGVTVVGHTNLQPNRLLRHHHGETEDEPVAQGILDLERSDHVETRYFVMYASRLLSFKSVKGFREGERPKHTIRLADVQDIKVFESGFFLQHHDHGFRFHSKSRKDFEYWTLSLNKLFHIDGMPGPDSSDPIHQGPLKLMSHEKPLKRFFVLYVDRLECYMGVGEARQPDPRGQVQVANIRGFQQLEDGFKFLKESGELELRVRDLKELEAWRDAFENVVNGGLRNGHCIFPIYQGPLGIQHGSSLVTKHFVLYPDRLDYFHGPEDVGTAKPCGRIALIEVADLAVFGRDGLVLNLGGRKVGLKATQEEERGLWDGHIRKTLTNMQKMRHGSLANANRRSRPERGSAEKEFLSPADAESLFAPSTPSRSVSPKRNVKPRVYDSLPSFTPRGQGSPSYGSPSPRNIGISPDPLSPPEEGRARSAPPGPRTPGTPSTFRSTGQPESGWVHLRTFNKWRHTGGRFWRTSQVSPKLNARTSTLKESYYHIQSTIVSDKINGGPRPPTPRAREFTPPPKVGEPDSDRRMTVKQLNKERAMRYSLAGKVTDPGRTFKVPESPDRSWEVTQKITTSPRVSAGDTNES